MDFPLGLHDWAIRPASIKFNANIRFPCFSQSWQAEDFITIFFRNQHCVSLRKKVVWVYNGERVDWVHISPKTIMHKSRHRCEVSLIEVVICDKSVVLASHSVGGDICAIYFVVNSQNVPCNDRLNPIWIDTVYFGMLLSVPFDPTSSVFIHVPGASHPPTWAFPHKHASRCNASGGLEGRCGQFLILSPSVWDLQTTLSHGL